MKTFGNLDMTYMPDEENIDIRPNANEAGYLPVEEIQNAIDFLVQTLDAHHAQSIAKRKLESL